MKFVKVFDNEQGDSQITVALHKELTGDEDSWGLLVTTWVDELGLVQTFLKAKQADDPDENPLTSLVKLFKMVDKAAARMIMADTVMELSLGLADKIIGEKPGTFDDRFKDSDPIH